MENEITVLGIFATLKPGQWTVRFSQAVTGVDCLIVETEPMTRCELDVFMRRIGAYT
jgi:hypothetical protein